MSIHPADKLLCVARSIAGNVHANYRQDIYFEVEYCQKCEGLTFCKKIERLVKQELTQQIVEENCMVRGEK
jgi:hypothetical protein